ncbi:MAG: glycerol-3-phosphate 1-O-acyltransferase PlsY [Oscillospiraceae bacterium]|nr:glycerol-3-phosphate 1-O-acyltransferase PlsY [Oscillospiraceae bacterium]
MLIWKILLPLTAYLLGNFNAGIVFSRLIYKKDIREHGSRNPGTTNAFRVLGKAAGFLVLFFDALKGAMAVLLARWLLPGMELWTAVAGLCAMLGHIFPVLYKFKGGKGVATTAGVTLAAQPKVLFTLLGPFFALLFGTKYMSLASVSAAALLPLVSLAWNRWQFTPIIWMALAQAVLMIFMHRENIRRLAQGKESRLFQGKEKVVADRKVM